MSKPPSDKTMLLSARRELRRCQEDLARLRLTAEQYRVRATKAEQEAAEWKERFDSLLRVKISPPPAAANPIKEE